MPRYFILVLVKLLPEKGLRKDTVDSYVVIIIVQERSNFSLARYIRPEKFYYILLEFLVMRLPPTISLRNFDGKFFSSILTNNNV